MPLAADNNRSWPILATVFAAAALFLFVFPESARAQFTGSIAFEAAKDGAQVPATFRIGWCHLGLGICGETDATLPGQLDNLPTGDWKFWHVRGGPPGAQFKEVTNNYNNAAGPDTSFRLIGGATVAVTYRFESPKVNNASCSGIDAPGSVTAGQSFTARVTMYNSGSKPWTSDSTPHNLGSQNPQDNARWGTGRVPLPFQPVRSQEPATFTFTATAPQSAGTYPFDWRMVEDGVEWFGQGCSRSITVNPQSGTLAMSATLDGQPWPGSFMVRTQDQAGNSATASVTVPGSVPFPPGTYTFSYVRDGPPNAAFTSITPSATQTLSSGGTITYTFNFGTSKTVNFFATIKNIGFVPAGPSAARVRVSGTSFFKEFYPLPVSALSGNGFQTVSASWQSPAGTYTVEVCADIPADAVLESNETNNCGSSTFGVTASPQGTLAMSATLDGQPWPGSFVVRTQDQAGNSATASVTVPGSVPFPPGTYTFSYVRDGPPNAAFQNITPTATQTLTAGGTIAYTYNFSSSLDSSQPAPAADIMANGSNGPITIAYNTAATITWCGSPAAPCANAELCEVSPTGWTGTSATRSTGNLTASQTYTLSCAGAEVGGLRRAASDTVTVNVPAPSLSASCSVSPTSATTGQTVTWSASASGGTGTYRYSWSGTDGLSGSTQSVNKSYSSAGTKTGSVTVTSDGQSVTRACSNSVTVSPANSPCIGTQCPGGGAPGSGANGGNFTATPGSISAGQSSTLSWATQFTTSCTITDDSPTSRDIGSVPLSCNPPDCPNSQDTVSPATTTTYTLSCTGPGGSVSATATVFVVSTPRFMEVAPE